MPQNPIKLDSSNRIVNDDGTITQVFRTWALQVSNNIPIVATGSPEGVVEAPQYSLYIDETTPATPVQYRKMSPEIGGDRTKGWAVI